MRAIYVDDEPIMLRAFRRITGGIDDMEIAGCFDNSDEAVEYVRNNPVDIVFADVLLPHTDGIELAEKLRKYQHGIYVVFVSALEKSSIKRVSEGDDYLGKPYSAKEIDGIIRNYYKKKVCG